MPGNHEYDNLDFDETHDRLRELCHALDIHWLERETRVMQGVRLVGTTLWTDFDALAQPDEELGSVLKKRAKAFRAADFYLAKAGMRRHGEPFMAEQMREQGIACQQWLDEALRQPFDGVTLVITHFAPRAGQRRSALRRHARHRRLLQCAGRAAAARRLLAARPPALRAGLYEGRLPCYRQSAGIRKEGRARELRAGADLGCEDGEVADG